MEYLRGAGVTFLAFVIFICGGFYHEAAIVKQCREVGNTKEVSWVQVINCTKRPS